METKRFLLCKFGEQRFIDDVFHGRLYMRPLSAFLGEENNAARRDPREDQSFLLQGDKFVLKMEIDGEFKQIPGIINIASRDPDHLKANVFCMYALREDKLYEPIDRRNLQFGNTFVLFRDTPEFLKRIRTAAENTGNTLQLNFVRYVDTDTYNDPLGIFTKSNEFSYQCEFRIALLPGTGSPYFLDIGDVMDIASSGLLTDITDEVPTE